MFVCAPLFCACFSFYVGLLFCMCFLCMCAYLLVCVFRCMCVLLLACACCLCVRIFVCACFSLDVRSLVCMRVFLFVCAHSIPCACICLFVCASFCLYARFFLFVCASLPGTDTSTSIQFDRYRDIVVTWNSCLQLGLRFCAYRPLKKSTTSQKKHPRQKPTPPPTVELLDVSE